MPRLKGKAALITGAARGTGAATARRFAAEGASILLADILDDRGRETAASTIPTAAYRRLDEIASMSLFLASDESSFCTGADFPVEGGATAGTVLAAMPKP